MCAVRVLGIHSYVHYYNPYVRYYGLWQNRLWRAAFPPMSGLELSIGIAVHRNVTKNSHSILLWFLTWMVYLSILSCGVAFKSVSDVDLVTSLIAFDQAVARHLSYLWHIAYCCFKQRMTARCWRDVRRRPPFTEQIDSGVFRVNVVLRRCACKISSSDPLGIEAFKLQDCAIDLTQFELILYKSIGWLMDWSIDRSIVL